MSELTVLTPTSWEAFFTHEVAVLLVGKSDCAACTEWSVELTELAAGDEFAEVAFGKVLLDTPGMHGFKRQNAWVKDVTDLPYTVIYKGGEVQKSFYGKGVDRLRTRLTKVLG